MHHHRHSTSKLSRSSAQRRALLRGLATALVLEGKITTTKAKAKAAVPYVEKLVTKAKRGGLANRRLVLAEVSTEAAVRKLYDEFVPRLGKRTSGFVSIKSVATRRRGDNAELATLSLLVEPAKPAETASAKESVTPAASKQPNSSEKQ